MNQDQQVEYENQVSLALDYLAQASLCLSIAVNQLQDKGKNGETLHHLETVKETFHALSLLLYPGDPEGYEQ